MDLEPLDLLHFEKHIAGKVLRCRIETFEDGAHVEGDEIEMIFEFAPDSIDHAIAHVEKLGYVRTR